MISLQHIMLVEDEPDIREIAQASLEELGGFTLTVCASGQDALAKAPIVKPQLILLDVMMPGMDGLETLSRLKNLPEAKEIPVIFMTARIQPSQVEHYVNSGAIGTIAKPFDPVKLATDVNKIWADYVAKHH